MRHFYLGWGMVLLGLTGPASAMTWWVSPTGSDTDAGTEEAPWRTVQKAASSAGPGDVVRVLPGIYGEKVNVTASGTATAPVVIRAEGPEGSVVLDGTGLATPGVSMVSFYNISYVSLEGFEIRNASGMNDAGGVRIQGAGTGVQIRRCRIHDIRGTSATGITVYGGSAAAISGLVVDDCEIWNCQPYPSETLTLNGNVEGFSLTGNFVHDNNYIGIDLIGGERWLQANPALVARNGLVKGNRVERCNKPFAGTDLGVGIYIDGGKNNIIEGNRVTGCDIGIEVGAENPGIVASGNVVRSNVVWKNASSGVIVGGAEEGNGRAISNRIYNNVFYKNAQQSAWAPEILIQYGWTNTFENNVMWAIPDSSVAFLWVEADNNSQTFRSNLWFSERGKYEGSFGWGDENGYDMWKDWHDWEGQDTGGGFANPLFLDPENGDFHIAANSPCLNAGYVNADIATGNAGTDFDGMTRSWARPEIGADEILYVDLWVRENFPGQAPTRAFLDSDSDGDGVTNWSEYAAGTNPNLCASVPRLSLELVTVNGVPCPRLAWPTRNAADVTVTLEHCLEPSAWSPVLTLPVATGTSAIPVLQWTLPTDTHGNACHFYRVRTAFKPL